MLSSQHFFRNETGIAVYLQHQCEEAGLPAIKEMQVLRIIQESLANIRKHSRAQNVRILVSCDNDGVYRALIEDDGVGFDSGLLKAASSRRGLGLDSMRGRAHASGGQLEMISSPGEGTIVNVVWPGSDATGFTGN